MRATVPEEWALDLHPPRFTGDWVELCRDLLARDGPEAALLPAPEDSAIDFLVRDARGAAPLRGFVCVASETGQASDLAIEPLCARLRRAASFFCTTDVTDVMDPTDVSEPVRDPDPLSGSVAPSDAGSIVLCTNVELTAPQRATLRAAAPRLELLEARAWRARCVAHWLVVAPRFDAWIRITRPHMLRLLGQTFTPMYVRMLEPALRSPQVFRLTVASNRHVELLEVPVVPTLRVCDLKDVLIRALRLPSTQLMRDESFRISISYALKRDGRRLPDERELGDVELADGDLVELTTRIVYEALRRRAIAAHDPKGPMRAPDDPSFTRALEKFETQYNAAWTAALAELRTHATDAW